MKSIMAAGAVFVFLTGIAHAACECRCVGGQNRPICENSLDLPPICPSTMCPLEPPSLQPLATPQLPPLGTSSCEMRQVYNPFVQQYQWQRLCH